MEYKKTPAFSLPTAKTVTENYLEKKKS